MRRRSAANWASTNEVLMDSEIGWERGSVPPKMKIGDGVTGWNALPYFVGDLTTFLLASQLDTDGALSANSDAKIPSQKAVRTYAQPKDSDLTDFAGLSPTNDDVLQRKSGAWASRSIAQLKADLGYGTMAAQASSSVAITGGTLAGISSAAFALGSNDLQVATTGQHLRMVNGAEFGIVSLQAGGQVDIWSHGDNSTDIVRMLTGSGSGTVRGSFGSFGLQVAGGIRPSSYTVATVPLASLFAAGAIIHVADESGGAVSAFSDGTNWRRMTDRAVIS